MLFAHTDKMYHYPYKFQIDLMKQLYDNDKNLIVKSRQMGITNTLVTYATMYAIANKGSSILFSCHSSETKKLVQRKLTKAIQLSRILSPNSDCAAYGSTIALSNGSRINLINSYSDLEVRTCSSLIDLCIIDEAAFSKNFFTLHKNLAPNVKTIITSTPTLPVPPPCSSGQYFLEMRNKCLTGQLDYNLIELPYTEHPDRDNVWYNDIVNRFGAIHANAEYALKL